MNSPAPAELQRWSEEVARDPSSLAFLPLARAYRKMGKRDAAMRLCLRGLERHPTHAEGHGLLALLYFDSGDRGRAADEWGMVLRLEPDNFEALRGMGFHYLEHGDAASARRHLLRAAEQRPQDTAVREALGMIETLQRESPQTQQRESSEADPWNSPDPFRGQPVQSTVAGQPVPAPGGDEPWASTPVGNDSFDAFFPELHIAGEPGGPPLERALAPATPAMSPSGFTAPANVAAAPPAPPEPRDPGAVFNSLKRDVPFLGALILDEQGLVLAGALTNSDGSEEALGAILGGAVSEAARTAAHLALGDWRGILLEAQNAVVHLAPLPGNVVVLTAARRDAPAGWVLRTAGRASVLAREYLEVQA